jgi:hypothetical protein
MKNFSKHKWWIVTALITAPLIALAAGLPFTFTANTPISSSQVNMNFASLDTRLTALEAASARTSVKVLLDNVLGPLPTTGRIVAFTPSGVNPIMIIVSATGYLPSGAASLGMDIAVQLDGLTIGHLTTYTNEVLSHKAFPTRFFSIATPPTATSHNIGLLPVNATSDANDFFSVAVVELH